MPQQRPFTLMEEEEGKEKEKKVKYGLLIMSISMRFRSTGFKKETF